MIDKKTEINKNIIQGRFALARDILVSITNKNERECLISSLLYDMAAYGPNACSYAFACYLINHQDDVFYHKTCIGLLEDCITYFPGVFQAAYYHAFKRVLLSNSSAYSLGYLLSTYDVPGGAVTDEEAREMAFLMLAGDQNDVFALRVIKNTDYLKDTVLRSTKEKEALALQQDPKAAIKEFIMRGRFFTAREHLLRFFTWEEVYELLLHIAAEEKNITAYAFVWMLINEEETSELHLLAAQIVNHWTRNQINTEALDGCPQVAFFHTQRSAGLSR